MITSIRTIRIGRITGPADAGLEHPEVVPVYVLIRIQVGILATWFDGFTRAGVTRLEVAEVLLIHVAVAVEVTPNGH